MESQILRWVQNIPSMPSVLGESRILGWIRQGVSSFFPKGRGISTSIGPSLGKWLLPILLFACVFIPRVSLGPLVPFYSLDLRGEDIPLLILTLVVFVMMVQRVSLFEVPSVERFFLLFLLAAEVSILNGLWMRTIDKPLLSYFYLLKWLEYFLVFVAAVRFTLDEKQPRFLLATFFLLGIVVAAYGWWEHFFPAGKAVYPNYYRLFERTPFHGDANHIGGLLVLWIGFFTGFFLNTKDRARAAIFLISLIFVLLPLAWTYSRKSYFALAAALLFPFIFKGTRKRLIFLLSILTLVSLVFPTRISERLLDLGEAFGSVDPFHSSWAANWVMWKQALWNFDQFFLWGSGLGSRHRLFYESQYILVLTETGLFGFFSLMLVFLAMVREMTSRFSKRMTETEKAMAVGWLTGGVGLLVHNMSCVSLTVAKIAIPFWFLTGGVFAALKAKQKPSP